MVHQQCLTLKNLSELNYYLSQSLKNYKSLKNYNILFRHVRNISSTLTCCFNLEIFSFLKYSDVCICFSRRFRCFRDNLQNIEFCHICNMLIWKVSIHPFLSLYFIHIMYKYVYTGWLILIHNRSFSTKDTVLHKGIGYII